MTHFILRPVLCAALFLSFTPRTIAQVTLVNMIPQTRSGETNQDAEPTIAINPSNKAQLVGTAFTWDNLTGSPMTGGLAPIYASTDGGQTWSLVFSVPSTAGANFPTGDITVHFSGTTAGTTNTLYTGILHSPDFSMRVYRAPDYRTNTTMTQLDTHSNNVDQPHVEAGGIGQDRVYVGFNNGFGGVAPQTATVDFSQNAGIAVPVFNLNLLEVRSTGAGGQDGFAIMPVAHTDGTVYAAFFGWRSGSTMDIVVMRDDNWASGGTPFRALNDSVDLQAGQRVITGVTIPIGNIGQERVGSSSLSLAVDPNNSSRVYVAWLDLAGTTPTLHVRRSIDRGQTWSSSDMVTVSNAVNPSLAINTARKVGFLYQQVTGVSPNQRWETHFLRTTDADATAWDSPGLTLASTSASTPGVTFSPYIGDYDRVVAQGRNFYGIFSASNYPDKANFLPGVTYQRFVNWTTHKLYSNAALTTEVAPSIDPFFFTVDEVAPPQIQLPASLTFPTTCPGSNSTLSASICNTGKSDLIVSGIASSNGQFTVAPPSSGYPVTIGPGACLPIQVTFTPTGSGLQTATLTVSSNDPITPSATIPVSGIAGTATIATLIANTGDFGEVCRGSFRDLPLTINNKGTCNLIVSNITSSSPDFRTATVVSYPLTIAPGTSLEVPMRFEPSGPGAKAGTITINTNDPVNPTSTVPVQGKGGQPVVATIVADNGDFGSVCEGSFKDLVVTISNSGTCPLKITNITSSSPEFKTAQVLSYPLTVAPGDSIQIPIRYQPTSAGSKTATITISTDDPVAPTKTVNLRAETDPGYICHPPKYFTLGMAIGPTFGPSRTGDYTFSGKARFLSPLTRRGTFSVQSEAEYMYYPGRQEGEFDAGLLDRIHHWQAGLFADFKAVTFPSLGNGELGQATFTLDYLFHQARLGAFATKGFLNDATIVQSPLTRLKIVDQIGISGEVRIFGGTYLEGDAEYLRRHASGLSDSGGFNLRIVHPLSAIIAVTGEVGLNESYLGPSDSGRVVFGVQLGHFVRPRDFIDKRHPLGTTIPRMHYELTH
jgi:hypothetical protein